MLRILAPNTPFPDDLAKGAVILVDKPLGWTSFDVVNKIRYRLSKRMGVKMFKVGHAGTLDPLASGLLTLCVGAYTKQIEALQNTDKEYTGVIAFGAVTASYDLEKPVEVAGDVSRLSDADVQAAKQSFIGLIGQVPPMFSAIKIDGRRVYRDARTGKQVEMEPRPVRIETFDIGALRPAATQQSAPIALNAKQPVIWRHPDYAEGKQADFLVRCGKGAYIRSLAADLGQALGCGAYLSALRRTRIGDFSVEDAWKVEDLTAFIQQ